MCIKNKVLIRLAVALILIFLFVLVQAKSTYNSSVDHKIVKRNIFLTRVFNSGSKATFENFFKNGVGFTIITSNQKLKRIYNGTLNRIHNETLNSNTTLTKNLTATTIVKPYFAEALRLKPDLSHINLKNYSFYDNKKNRSITELYSDFEKKNRTERAIPAAIAPMIPVIGKYIAFGGTMVAAGAITSKIDTSMKENMEMRRIEFLRKSYDCTKNYYGCLQVLNHHKCFTSIILLNLILYVFFLFAFITGYLLVELWSAFGNNNNNNTIYKTCIY